jgi:hypothetical protein
MKRKDAAAVKGSVFLRRVPAGWRFDPESLGYE